MFTMCWFIVEMWAKLNKFQKKNWCSKKHFAHYDSNWVYDDHPKTMSYNVMKETTKFLLPKTLIPLEQGLQTKPRATLNPKP
jgi:hypothetical protein